MKTFITLFFAFIVNAIFVDICESAKNAVFITSKNGNVIILTVVIFALVIFNTILIGSAYDNFKRRKPLAKC